MSKSSKKNTTDLQLDDSAIAQIAKILQMAILTGTDVVDNLRLMRLSPDDGKLVLSEDYAEKFNNDVSHMVESIDKEDQPTFSDGVFSVDDLADVSDINKDDVN
jgi:aromatic ring-opening dioxygenase catalytic subunit (LigB family)